MAQEQDHKKKLEYPLDCAAYILKNILYPTHLCAYKILDKISVSPTSVVYKAECLPKNSTVAMKSIDLDQSRGNSETNTVSPSTTLLSGGHPNILQLHGSFTSGRRLWVVMPFMSTGSLKSIISSSAFPDGLPEPIIAEVLKETLNVVSFLYNQGRSVSEIKTENILIGSNGDVKLADFRIYELGTSKDGSFSSCDILSFGITAMKLALGRSPLFLASDFEKREKSKNKKFFSKEFKDMVASCLNQDPSKRPSAGDLQNHSFFKNCKGADFIVKNLLQGLPTIEERFKQSKACAAAGEDNDDGLKGQIAKIYGWNFNEDEFELVPIFATKTPQEQDDDTVVQMVRFGGETIILDQKLESGGSDLNALGRVGDEALVGAGDLVVDGNQRERTLDGLILLRRTLHAINLINATFIMLQNALYYRIAFMHMKLSDCNYTHCPSKGEWDDVRKI